MQTFLWGAWEILKLLLQEAALLTFWLAVGGAIGLTVGLTLGYLAHRFLFPHQTWWQLRSEQNGWRLYCVIFGHRSWQAAWWGTLPLGFLLCGLVGGSAHSIKVAMKRNQVMTCLGEKAALPLVQASWRQWAPQQYKNADLDTPIDINIMNSNLGKLLEASPESLAQIQAKDGTISPSQAWWLSQGIRLIVMANADDAALGQLLMQDLRQVAKPLPNQADHMSVTLREGSLVFCRRVIDPVAAGWLSNLIWSQTLPILSTVAAVMIVPLVAFWSSVLFRRHQLRQQRLSELQQRLQN